MAIKEDLKSLNSMIQQMDEHLQTYEELIDTTVIDVYDLDKSIKDKIASMTNDEIDNITEEELISKLNECNTDDVNNYEALKYHHTAHAEEGETFLDYGKRVFKEIKESLNELETTKKEKENLVKEANKIADDYFTYVNSAEYKEKKKARLEEMKKQAAEETDIAKKRKIEKMLSDIEKSDSLQFLFDRVETLGNKEIENITNIFFNDTRSTLVMNKFVAKLPRYGYNKDNYKMFFNLEEKFLPEEYHDLNNVFLFHVMRFISYTDPDNKTDAMFVGSILVKLFNLLYHKFENDDEKAFVNIIKRFDDYFMDNIERFKKYNTTSPNHPERIKRDKEYEEKYRLMVITSLQNEGIDVDTTLSTEELRHQLQEIIDKKNQVNELPENENIFNDIEDIDANEVNDESEAENNNEETAIPNESVTNHLVLKDKYGDYYDLQEDGTYTLFNGENNTVIEQGISEETILRLKSCDALTETAI